MKEDEYKELDSKYDYDIWMDEQSKFIKSMLSAAFFGLLILITLGIVFCGN